MKIDSVKLSRGTEGREGKEKGWGNILNLLYMLT